MQKTFIKYIIISFFFVFIIIEAVLAFFSHRQIEGFMEREMRQAHYLSESSAKILKESIEGEISEGFSNFEVKAEGKSISLYDSGVFYNNYNDKTFKEIFANDSILDAFANRVQFVNYNNEILLIVSFCKDSISGNRVVYVNEFKELLKSRLLTSVISRIMLQSKAKYVSEVDVFFKTEKDCYSFNLSQFTDCENINEDKLSSEYRTPFYNGELVISTFFDFKSLKDNRIFLLFLAAFISFIIIAIALIINYLLIRREIKYPVESIKQTLDNISQGKYQIKTPFVGRYEFTDIYDSIIKMRSRIMEREIDLIQSLERAEMSEKFKTTLINNIRHEIRTPLNGILGFSQIMLEEDENKYTRIVYDCGKQLEVIVNQLIDFTKLEVGEIKANITELKIDDFIISLERELKDEYTEKISGGIELNIKKECLDNIVIDTDPLLLKQIINNLTNNAFKFTSEGKIEIEFSLNNNNLIIKVDDTGIGVPERHKKEITEAFVQADSELTRRFGGMGLGLTISNKLAYILDGRISFDSSVDKGSSFKIEIPLAKIKFVEQEQNVKVDNCFKGKKILLIESEKVCSLLIEKVLCNRGAIVDLLAAMDIKTEGFAHEAELIILDLSNVNKDKFEEISTIINPNRLLLLSRNFPDYVLKYSKEKDVPVIYKPFDISEFVQLAKSIGHF